MTEQAEEKKPRKARKLIFIIIGVLFGLLVLCLLIGSCSTSPSTEATKTAEAFKETQISYTSTVTNIPQDTSTPAPTNTKTPIPSPTNTPIPTRTPSPTPAPEPIMFQGSGDDVVDLSVIWSDSWGDTAFLHIIGPTVYDNFIVYSYDMSGNKDELLVNTIGSYDGYLLLLSPIGRLSIEAGGAWSVEALPLIPQNSHLIGIPGTYSGHDDDVVVLIGSPDLAIFDAPEYDNFIVYVLTSTGEKDLLVNEIGPYTGTKILPNNAFMLEVFASGDWSVEITKK